MGAGIPRKKISNHPPKSTNQQEVQQSDTLCLNTPCREPPDLTTGRGSWEGAGGGVQNCTRAESPEQARAGAGAFS